MYMSITKEQLKRGWKKYLHCEECGEFEREEWVQESGSWDLLPICPECNVPMTIVTAIHIDSEDFIILEE